jgi:PqqD family protein of HPr-rel-A system
MVSKFETIAVSDTGFVFDARTGNTYAVNATGLAVLRALKDGQSLAQIEDEVVAGFQHATSVDEHLKQFIDLLVEVGLVPESEKIR